MTGPASAGLAGARAHLRLRHACREDAASLAALAADTFAGAYRHAVPPEDLAEYLARTFTAAGVEAEIDAPGTRVLVAEDEGGPCGYAKTLAGAATTGVDGTRPLQLERLYVRRDGLGGGIGARLLEAVFEQVRSGGFDPLWLRVWDGNHGAIRFYRRHGFRPVCLEPYQVGSTEKQVLVMVCPVVPAG